MMLKSKILKLPDGTTSLENGVSKRKPSLLKQKVALKNLLLSTMSENRSFPFERQTKRLYKLLNFSTVHVNFSSAKWASILSFS